MNKEEWEKEFKKYKTFPEGKQRIHMTLEEFKFIYFWEYIHRMLGRFLGIFFAFPAAIFFFKYFFILNFIYFYIIFFIF